MVVAAERQAPTIEDARRAALAIRDELDGNLFQVLLYGSVARGTQHEHSDIDLMVVLGDLDYSKRYETRCQLKEIASSTGDNEYSVNVTDVPEWNNRQQVSSSFENNIANDVVCLAVSNPTTIKPNKKMVKPMSNEQEALRYIENKLLPALRRMRNTAFFSAPLEEFPSYLDEDKETREQRIRDVCEQSCLTIEQSLKTLLTLQGTHPTRLRQISHSFDSALNDLKQPSAEHLREIINNSGIPFEEVSTWRVENTYPDDLDVLNGHADAYVDDYIEVAIATASAVMKKVEQQTGATSETKKLRVSLNAATHLSQTTEVRTAEPLGNGSVRHPTAKSGTFPPSTAAKSAVCGVWMPKARKPCVLRAGHKGSHRSIR